MIKIRLCKACLSELTAESLKKIGFEATEVDSKEDCQNGAFSVEDWRNLSKIKRELKGGKK